MRSCRRCRPCLKKTSNSVATPNCCSLIPKQSGFHATQSKLNQEACTAHSGFTNPHISVIAQSNAHVEALGRICTDFANNDLSPEAREEATMSKAAVIAKSNGAPRIIHSLEPIACLVGRLTMVRCADKIKKHCDDGIQVGAAVAGGSQTAIHAVQADLEHLAPVGVVSLLLDAADAFVKIKRASVYEGVAGLTIF